MSFISDSFIRKMNCKINNDQAFIMMPFENSKRYKSNDIFNNIKNCLIENKDLEIRPIKIMRADSIFNTQNIMSRIWEFINRSGILIADLSTRNPNVMYEVGLCHSMGRDVIIISDNDEDVPIDLRVGSTYIHYRDLQELLDSMPHYVNSYIEANKDTLFGVENIAKKIRNDKFLKNLFFEICEYEGRYISQQIDNSRLKDKYAKKKYSICLSDSYYINMGLFEIEGFDEYGAGIIKITEFGHEVKKVIENS